MWVEGWERTKLTIHYTFSEMLAINPFVQGVYIGFCAFYTVVTFTIVGLCLKYYWKDGIDNVTEEEELRKKDLAARWFIAFSVFYFTLSIIKIGCMWAIAWVDTNNYPTPHAILAAFAFGSAIFCSILLFLRRVSLSYLVPKPHLSKWFYMTNLLWVSALLGLGITLCIIRTGEYEFTVMLMVVLDPLFQLYDFSWEPDLEHRYNNLKTHSAIRLGLHPKKGFLEKLFWKKHIY